MPICSITREELTPKDAVSYHTIEDPAGQGQLLRNLAERLPQRKRE